MGSINKELERYVRTERENGTPDEAIRNDLLGKGWEYSEVEVSLTDSRPGPVNMLFTRTFFRFAFGFILIILASVAVILITGAISSSHAQESDMAETQK